MDEVRLYLDEDMRNTYQWLQGYKCGQDHLWLPGQCRELGLRG